MSYKAFIAEVESVRPIEGKDRIQIAIVLNTQVIVGTDIEPGYLGVLFPEGGVLSERYCEANNLIGRKDENGNKVGGYFDENRRVKALKMGGVKSEGYFAPISSLSYLGGKEYEDLKVGDSFDTLNGELICEKYETKATKNAKSQKQGQPRKLNRMFKEHKDTDQFDHYSQNIEKGSLITLTEKIHGTSHRIGHVLETAPVVYTGIMKWVAKLLKLPTEKEEWTVLNGTRRVVMGPNRGFRESFYKDDNFRLNAVAGIVPHKNETLYGEIVGWTGENSLIMPVHNLDKLKDKSIVKRFGKYNTYAYGCAPGTCKFYIYRITMTNSDGVVTELSWDQITARATELGVPTVPFIDQFIFDGSHRDLQDKISKMVDGDDGEAKPSMLDSTHIWEGIVIRTDSKLGTKFYKKKSFVFKVAEGICKDTDYVDLEEAS